MVEDEVSLTEMVLGCFGVYPPPSLVDVSRKTGLCLMVFVRGAGRARNRTWQGNNSSEYNSPYSKNN